MVDQKLKDLIHVKYVLFWVLIIFVFIIYSTLINDSICFSSIGVSLILALTYVGSLHVWKNPEHRDNPTTIKRRFISVTLVMLMSPFLIYEIVVPKQKFDLWSLLGLRLDGIVQAVIIPLLLTMFLFLGPIMLQFLDGLCSSYLKYWKSNFRNWIWLRNHIMAPISEELTFRACMLPGLVSCVGEVAAIFICPLFFGIAHLHHFNDLRKSGHKALSAITIVGFQFIYTTVFGAYSAFLFLRTGHLLAPVIVHSFCNHMGVPDFHEIPTYQKSTQILLWISFAVGLIGWMFLLMPLTSPHFYKNQIYWQQSS